MFINFKHTSPFVFASIYEDKFVTLFEPVMQIMYFDLCPTHLFIITGRTLSLKDCHLFRKDLDIILDLCAYSSVFMTLSSNSCTLCWGTMVRGG